MLKDRDEQIPRSNIIYVPEIIDGEVCYNGILIGCCPVCGEDSKIVTTETEVHRVCTTCNHEWNDLSLLP